MKRMKLVILTGIFYISGCAPHHETVAKKSELDNELALRESSSEEEETNDDEGETGTMDGSHSGSDDKRDKDRKDDKDDHTYPSPAPTPTGNNSSGGGSNTSTNNPTAQKKPECPAMPVIANPVSKTGLTCLKSCQLRLRAAAAYVNALATKPNLIVPKGKKLTPQKTAMQVFNDISLAGNQSQSYYRTACNPLAGKLYGPLKVKPKKKGKK